MRYYAEGSPAGPETFTSKSEAERFARDAANRFGVSIELYDSRTHEPIRRTLSGTYGEPTGAPFAIVRPRKATR